jgi:hypothetical protein
VIRKEIAMKQKDALASLKAQHGKYIKTALVPFLLA